MTKKIETLVPDIYYILENPHEWDKDKAEELGHDIAKIILEKLEKDNNNEPAYLRMSNLGSPCLRELWYKINIPDAFEKLPAPARLKFLFGDIIEQVLLFLAKEAGHEVNGKQTRLELFGVKGSRDAIIDGVTVDTKSASTQSFYKFRSGLTPDKDDFGYLTQLDGYREAGKEDPLVVDKDRAAFLVADKTLGNVTLDIHKKRNVNYEKMIAERRAILNKNKPPERPIFNKEEGTTDFADGKSGNRKLGTKCSYCGVKNLCWENNLRAFAYSGGPRYLTQVIRLPDVPELHIGELPDDEG